MSARARSRDNARRFGPMTLLLAPILIAAFVLPSALNVNQSNPSPTLEYAPVPASNDNPPPQIGNLQTLALARTTGLRTQGNGAGDGGSGGGAGAPGLPPPPLPLQVKRVPSSKTCVGNPPRQTEDPYSPPCVATFRGDNGGATYGGVTKDEIKVLFYFKAYNVGPNGAYWDLGRAPTPGSNEPDAITSLRTWQQYFNQRYQTYGRFVRFYAFAGTGDDAESRRADAALNWSDIHPFAVVIHAPVGEPYMQEMARHGVMAFTGSLDGGQFISSDAYNEIKPLGWGTYASSELKAQIFSAYVCNQLAGHPASFAGDPTLKGQPRKYGFWFSTDPKYPEYTRYAQQVLPQLKKCGVNPIPHSYAVNHWNNGAANTQSATQAAADWQRNGVTTVIWPGGEEASLSKAMGQIGYHPELVISDDHFLSGNQHADTQDPTVFQNAVLITDVPSFQRLDDTYCSQAYKDTSSTGGTWACQMYPSILQLFTGIQVSGPRLTPPAMDQGFHAIPAVASKDPTTPACFYLTADYTCEKDATLQWWDGVRHADRVSYDQGPCWRSVDGGARYLAGDWPRKDRMATVDRVGAADHCNNSVQGILLTTTSTG